LTYEFSIAPTGPTPIALASIPVKVAVLGQFSREETFDGGPASPGALADAQVIMRSDSNLPLTAPDVFSEQANSGSAAFPNFDKVLSLSLIPGHVYTIDVIAGCRHFDGGFVASQVSASSGCTALADPEFTLDQAALDAQLGTNTFTLTSFYQLEFSPGVTAVPEPSQALLFLAGLSGLAALRRHRGRIARRALDHRR